MKVYTLTWYEGNNYGSVLQAYALPRAIQSMGYQCQILGYHPSAVASLRQKIANKSLMATFRYKINEKAMQFSGSRSPSSETADSMTLFHTFREAEMTVTERCSDAASIMKVCGENAVFVCGSDQIWNPYYYDPYYFLEFVKNSKQKIAYAPSFGVNQIPDSKKEKMKKALSSFKHLSVREQSGKEIVQALTGKQAQVVVDPTMLMPLEQWNSVVSDFQNDEPYLFCYFLGKNEEYLRIAQMIAEKFHLRIQMLPMVAEDFSRPETIKQAVGPREFLAYVKNAAFVLTDSFHCSAFAIRYHRQFYVLQRFASKDLRGQNTRIESLLRLSSFEDRLIVPGIEIEYCLLDNRRFERSDSQINREIEQSKTWLEKALAQSAME